MILLEELTHWYPKRPIAALSSVNLQIREGTVFGLLGPNAAGKTTLLKILATLLIHTSGNVTIDGIDLRAHPALVRSMIGFSSGEERSFYYRLTGYQNLEFFGAIYGVPRRVLLERICRFSEFMDIGDQLHIRYGKYNLGSMKKLGIIRALLTDAKFLLLDEPNNAIDAVSAVRIRQLIALLANHGKSIIITTHNIQEVERVCGTIGILNHGKLLVSGDLGRIKESFGKKMLEIKISKPDGTEQSQTFLERCGQVANVHVSYTKDGKVLVRCSDSSSFDYLRGEVMSSNLCVESMTNRQDSLEDIFLNLTR